MLRGTYLRTEEHKRKLSEAIKGSANPNFGKKHSKETRCKMSEAAKGSGNSRWKGGRRYHSGGYILIFKPEHPFADIKGCILEHRLVMGERLGRYLRPQEVVHHINENKSDNRIENLRLFVNARGHSEYHKGAN